MSGKAGTLAQVKELRERTGAGIVDCQKALAESGGDVEKAIVFLREKGLATAAKRAGRAAAQGTVGAYIHGGGKIGVLVEVNCETDFVARTEAFQRLVKDIAMQVAAANPQYVRREEVSEAERERERGIYHAQTAQSSKPAAVIERIVAGKMEKFYSDTCLLEQPFIRDPGKTVEQLVKEAVARTGENIVVRRFSRFQIGEAEGSEEKSGQSA
ncbi:MAG: translation elongation factor Ts [Deltaproteobacteria bacterium]|nr:translation elongation factor Ts [Deltaproteobacteria bacterium]